MARSRSGRKIKRLALIETFKRLPSCIARLRPASGFVKGQKNDYNDAEAIAEAALRPNLRTMREKSQGAARAASLPSVHSRLVSRGMATITRSGSSSWSMALPCAPGVTALRHSLFDISKIREDEISPRMSELIVGLCEDWLWLDERIETITKEIEEINQREGNYLRLMSVLGVGPLISTAVVAAICTGEAFDRGRDFGAWLGLVPRQYSSGGCSIIGSISIIEEEGQAEADAASQCGPLTSAVDRPRPRA
jgi:transposase